MEAECTNRKLGVQEHLRPGQAERVFSYNQDLELQHFTPQIRMGELFRYGSSSPLVSCLVTCKCPGIHRRRKNIERSGIPCFSVHGGEVSLSQAAGVKRKQFSNSCLYWDANWNSFFVSEWYGEGIPADFWSLSEAAFSKSWYQQ